MNRIELEKRWVWVIPHLAFVCLFAPRNSLTQNLVLNPSFEETDTIDREGECQFDYRLFKNVSYWSELNTVDYIDTASKFVNYGHIGKVNPHTGKAMAGLYLLDVGDGWLPEYLFQRMEGRIKPGTRYLLRFYVHFRSDNGYFPSELQWMFCNDDPCLSGVQNIQGEIFSFPLKHSSKYENAWIELSKEIALTGEADFLVIGFFGEERSVTRKKGKRLNAGIYIFLDDVSLTNLDEVVLFQEPNQKNPMDTAEIAMSLGLFTDEKQSNLPIKLASLENMPTFSFEFNSWQISSINQQMLNELIPKFLERNCPIRINGHADKSEENDSNTGISNERAKAIAAYFVAHGFPEEKISIVPYGSMKPMFIGDDEFSKSMNCRVEVTLDCK